MYTSFGVKMLALLLVFVFFALPVEGYVDWATPSDGVTCTDNENKSSTYSCNSSYACCTVQGANGCCGYSVTVDEWLSQSTVPGIFAASFAVTIIVFFFYFASADTSLPKEEERGSPAWVNYIAPSEESKDSIHDSSGKPSTTPAVATNTKSVP